jgi:16S rRNA (uracil1498-N3)-methyltransferase
MAHFQQFFVHPDDVHDDCFYLRNDELAHAVRVTRKRPGNILTAVDGRGNRYEGPIQLIGADRMKVQIQNVQKNIIENRLHLTLVQALTKGSHLDWLVERGVEIGIAAFQLISTERSIATHSRRTTRWQKIALAAMKQSRRSRCADIYPPMAFDRALGEYNDRCAFIAQENEPGIPQGELGPILAQRDRAALFVGPEGGFTSGELQRAVEFGARPLTLGPWRLRSETAGLVGAVKVLLAAGELG